MKRLLIIGFVLGISLTAYSQNKSLEIGAKTNTFHSSYDRLERERVFENLQTKSIVSVNRFYGDLFANLIDTNNRFYRLGLGYRSSKIKSKSVRVGDYYGIQNDRIKFVYVGLGIGKQYVLEKFQFRFFGELPVQIMIQNHREIEIIRYTGQGTIQDKTVLWSKEPKSLITGLNVGYSVYYKLSKTISVGLETKTGFMLTYIKGDFEYVTDVYDNQDNLLQSYIEPSSRENTTINVLPVEVSLGLRIRL